MIWLRGPWIVAVLALGCGGGGSAAPSDAGPAGDGEVPDDGSGADAAADAGFDPDRFAVRLVSFEPGPGAGFGEDALPEVVLGPPRGGGDANGSTHVVSLGTGGTIVVELGVAAVDGPGPDLIVFENPFEVGSGTFAEPGTVGVSADGDTFTDFPCDPTDAPDYPGCAGTSPVYANVDTNTIDPLDPEVAGGDAFDLADIGVERARYVRIRDGEVETGLGGGSEGFDLDAVGVVNPAPAP